MKKLKTESQLLEEKILRMQAKLTKVKAIEVIKDQIPKRDRRGRNHIIKKASERAWLIQHLELQPDSPSIYDDLNNARRRPINRLKDRVKLYGEPVYQKPLFKNELTACPYAIGGVFDDGTKFIAEVFTIPVESHQIIHHFQYDLTSKNDKEKEAIKLIENIDLNDEFKDNAFMGIRDYFKIAQKVKDREYLSNQKDKLPNRICFALALAFLCKGYDPEKHKSQLKKWAGVGLSLQNRELPPNEEDYNYDSYINACINNFVVRTPGQGLTDEKGNSEGWIKYKAWVLAAALSEVKEKLKFKHYPDIDKKIKQLRGRVITNNKGDLRVDQGYPQMPLNDLNTILDAACRINNKSLFNRLILQLSTALRNNETDRIELDCLDQSDNTIIFNKPIPRLVALKDPKNLEGYLSAKTEDSVPRDTLKNASTSIVTRIILKHFDHHPDADLVNEFWNPHGELRKALETKDAVQRSLRTTAATNLCFSSSSKICPNAPHYTQVQAKMSHSTPQTVITVYADSHPPDLGKHKNIDTYLGIKPFVVNNGKTYEVHKIENAWDLWLLFEFIERHGLKNVEKYIYDEIKEEEDYNPPPMIHTMNEGVS